METTIWDLPVPGGPVTAVNGELTALRTAARCSSFRGTTSNAACSFPPGSPRSPNMVANAVAPHPGVPESIILCNSRSSPAVYGDRSVVYSAAQLTSPCDLASSRFDSWRGSSGSCISGNRPPFSIRSRRPRIRSAGGSSVASSRPNESSMLRCSSGVEASFIKYSGFICGHSVEASSHNSSPFNSYSTGQVNNGIASYRPDLPSSMSVGYPYRRAAPADVLFS